IGALPRATGRFEQLRAKDGCPDVTGQVQQDRCWFAAGVAMIRNNPKAWLARIPAKLGYTFDHESFAVEYLHEARPEDWPDDRRAAARAILSNVHRALVVLAALACVAWHWRRAPTTEAARHKNEVHELEAALGMKRIGFGPVMQALLLVGIV